MRTRFLLPVAAAIVFAGGCVPVTQPLTDIEKAEPDKELVGAWTVTKTNGFSTSAQDNTLTFDVPEVKDNPKGLMRVVMKKETESTPLWFIVSPVGKHKYANILLPEKEGPLQFEKAGVYADWQKVEKKQFFVFRYVRDGDTLTIDCGNFDAFRDRMTTEKIRSVEGKHVEFFETPAGWLAKYFDKNGSDKVFDGSNSLVARREKK
jgi:hypothetical protein